jgi:hypothetical protein
MSKKKKKKMEGSENEIFDIKSLDIKSRKTRTEIRVERFIVDQMDRYIRLHKEHEKDLNYIG